jgi:hypothetical protein
MSVRHALLALLSEGPKYGLLLRQEFEAGTGEVWPLNVGQVYTTLQRLERDGHVESDESPRTARRRTFGSRPTASRSSARGCGHPGPHVPRGGWSSSWWPCACPVSTCTTWSGAPPLRGRPDAAVDSPQGGRRPDLAFLVVGRAVPTRLGHRWLDAADGRSACGRSRDAPTPLRPDARVEVQR